MAVLKKILFSVFYYLGHGIGGIIDSRAPYTVNNIYFNFLTLLSRAKSSLLSNTFFAQNQWCSLKYCQSH